MIRRLCVSCLAFFRHWNKNEWRTAWLLLLLLLLDPSVAACLCVLIYFVLPHSWNNRNNNRPTRETDLATPCTLHLAPDTWNLKPFTTWELDRTTLITISYRLRDIHYTTLHIHIHTPHFVHSIECILSFCFSFVSLSIYFLIFWYSDFLIWVWLNSHKYIWEYPAILSCCM